MIYDIEDIRRQVRVMMDENDQAGMLEDIDDIDTLSLNDIITDVIPDVLRDILLESPSEKLGEGLRLPTEVSWESGRPGIGMCSMLLPEDFLRIIMFQMSDWVYGVSEPISADSDLYRMQKSRFGSLRGRPERPVVALVPQSTGLTLEAYGSRAGDGVFVKRGRYLAIPKIEDGGIDIPPLLVRDTVKAAAEAVLGILGKGGGE